MKFFKASGPHGPFSENKKKVLRYVLGESSPNFHSVLLLVWSGSMTKIDKQKTVRATIRNASRPANGLFIKLIKREKRHYYLIFLNKLCPHLV